ncbi:hypothetical protein MATL_G00078780 [Megalops atlanticus]|uniref:Uncharacterized protein n=1 Tax=Megalops atlanticus TaxID=7932 RepID=A0A9D3Q5L7_MEGAT|nr:hypothetical protein MATL_G00078780 [Megalops atlanticus]
MEDHLHDREGLLNHPITKIFEKENQYLTSLCARWHLLQKYCQKSRHRVINERHIYSISVFFVAVQILGSILAYIHVNTASDFDRAVGPVCWLGRLNDMTEWEAKQVSHHATC